MSGGAATGGVFLANGGVVPVAVENQVAPGTGGATLASINAPPAIDAFRTVAFSAGLAGGSASGGVFVYHPEHRRARPAAVLAGDTVPGVSSPLASFGHVALGSGGMIAFVAELADGRSGVFVATPVAVIPGVPSVWGVGLALGLVALARASLRRLARSRA